MNEIVNMFLLEVDNFMPETHLKQPGFTYNTCGRFTKNKERIKNNSRYIFQNKLDKTCFQHDMACVDFKDLPKITAADKILLDKAFNAAKNPKNDGYQCRVTSMVYKFFNKETLGDAVKSEIMQKPTIKKFEKRKVHSSFKYNIWGADQANMQLMNKFNKGFQFLLRVIDTYSKYTWVVPLKDKKGITITNAFQNILDESGRKLNKVWADKGSDFCIGSMKLWLQDNDMHSTYSKGKSVFAERFIRTLKNKIVTNI